MNFPRRFLTTSRHAIHEPWQTQPENAYSDSEPIGCGTIFQTRIRAVVAVFWRSLGGGDERGHPFAARREESVAIRASAGDYSGTHDGYNEHVARRGCRLYLKLVASNDQLRLRMEIFALDPWF